MEGIRVYGKKGNIPWGVIGIEFNHDKTTYKDRQLIREIWEKQLSENFCFDFFKSNNPDAEEAPPFSKNGEINFLPPNFWDKHFDYSYVLCTVTRPEKQYPTIEDIAGNVAIDIDHRNYFFNNREHGIKTDDDDQIISKIDPQVVKKGQAKAKEHRIIAANGFADSNVHQNS